MPKPIEAPEPVEAVPGVPDADDIPEVIAPPGALAPLAVDPLLSLRDDMHSFMRGQDHMWLAIEKRLQALSPMEAGALQHLCDALDGLKAGLMVTGSPYLLTMHALTPQGFPVDLTIQRQDGAAFFEAVTNMSTWLAQSGFTVPPAAVAF